MPLLDEAEMTQNNSRVLGHVPTFPLFSGYRPRRTTILTDGRVMMNLLYEVKPFFSHNHVTLVNNNSYQL